VDVVDDRRAQPEPEGEQVDDRLERARERRRLPEGAEVRDLAAHDARDGGRLDAAHQSASSPVSRTKTSSRFAARTIAPSGTAPSGARSDPTMATAGPAGRTRRPAPSARARTSS